MGKGWPGSGSKSLLSRREQAILLCSLSQAFLHSKHTGMGVRWAPLKTRENNSDRQEARTVTEALGWLEPCHRQPCLHSAMLE